MSYKKSLDDYVDNIQLQLRDGNFNEALKEIQRALSDYPTNPKLYINGGNIFKIGVKEVDFSYRSCSLLKNNIALEATLLGQPDNIESIAERMASFSQKRWSGQPKARSAGCIFKNPECITAGQLIDELGFKGESEGGAMVSVEHGNFIVNKGGATAEDFLKLIERIRRRAHDERGLDLTTEVQIIGRREDHG